MMPPKSLINLAPPYPTKLKHLRAQHATSPWFGEGRRGASLGLWWSLKGKLAATLSLEYLSSVLREEIPVVGLFPALLFHVSEESSRSLPRMRGSKHGRTFLSIMLTIDSYFALIVSRTCLLYTSPSPRDA